MKHFVHLKYLCVFAIAGLPFFTACQSDQSKENETGATIEGTEQPAAINPADTVNRYRVRQQLELVFKQVENDNLEGLAGQMLYRGNDSTRLWHDHLHLDDATDRYTVETTSQVIDMWMSKGNSWEYGVYEIEKGMDNKDWYTQEVVFISDDGIDRRQFSFQEMEGRLFLVNID